MSMAVVYSAPIVGVGEDIARGDVLIFNGTAYVRSTAAARAGLGGRRSTGVSFTDGDEDTGVTMLVTGPVPTVVSGLGPGAEGWVRTSAVGRLERAASPDPLDDVMGWCDSTGRVTSLTPAGQSALSSGPQGWLNVRAYGATGDGVADDHAAFVAAIAAAGDGIVWVPPGTYRLASNLVLRRRVHIIGAGGVQMSDDADALLVSTSVLAPDPGVSVVLDSDTSSGGNGSAVGSVLDDLAIQQHADEATGTHVVQVYARALWRGCTIYGVPAGGHGWAVLSGNHETTRSEWYGCHVNGTGGDGWHILIGNSNIIGGTAVDCVGKGVMVAALFGCLVSGVRLTGCGIGGDAFQISGPIGDEDGQGQHIAAGCAVGGGQGTIRLGASSTWIGGPSAAGLNPLSRGQWLPSGAAWSPINVSNDRSGIIIECAVGVASTNQIAFQWQSRNDGSEFRLFYDGTTNAQRWPIKYMGAAGNGAVEFTAAGHAEGAGNLLVPRGMVLGNGSGRRIVNFASAPPTGASPRASGNWAVGDILWNDCSSTTVAMLWRCSVAGNPGTWVAHNF